MFRLAQFRKRDKGNEHVQKYRTIPKLASESSSCGHATSEEQLVTFQAEQSSHRGVTGKPIKKLLADEMSKEAVAKKKPPSVIAKFIGLDVASSSKLGKKQNMGLWDKYSKRTSSVGADRNEKPRGSKLSKKNSAEMHRIKNMFNYQEASNVADRRKLSKRRNYEEELAFMRKKNEEIIRDSDENRRKWRVKSNREVLEEFLQQPDSLFIKHVLEQKGRHSSSHCNHIALMSPTNSIKFEANTKGWIEEIETSRKCELDLYERRDHRLLELYGGRGTPTSLRSSEIRLEPKEETVTPPRKIFVLKPSFGQTNNATNKRDSGSRVEKGVFDETEICCRKCREEIATAKGITGQMRNSFGNLTSRNFLSNWYDHDNPPLPMASDYSVSREAKMRISERWKVTHGYIDVEGIGQGSTLGEMLSTPDRQRKSKNLRSNDKKLHPSQPRHAFTKKFTDSVPEIIPSHKLTEINIKIDDLAKGKLLVPQTPDDINNIAKGKPLVPQTPDDISNLAKGKPLVPQTPADISNLAKGKPLVPQTPDDISNLAKGKPLVPHTLDAISNAASVVDPMVKTNVIMSSGPPFMLVPFLSTCAQNNFEIDDLAEENPLLLPDGISSTASAVDAKVNTDVIMFSDSSSELIPLLSACVLGDGNSSALHEDVTNFQGPSNGKPEGDSDALQIPEPELEPEPESETSEVSKEVDHQSPVSTLEVPSTEDSSSGFDSLERVNADIQELRMHLNQLKMESDKEVASDKKVLVEEAEEQDEEGLVEYDCWKSMYIVDLLVESGLYGTDPGSFISNCYSPDSPLDPSLFNILEKKYSDEITGPKQLRKILYDHINELLLEIYWSVMESYPWVKARVGFGLKWETGGVEEQLGNLLENYSKEALKNVSDTVLDKSESWYEPRDVVDAIGKKIQELLLDDLITEVFLNM